MNSAKAKTAAKLPRVSNISLITMDVDSRTTGKATKSTPAANATQDGIKRFSWMYRRLARKPVSTARVASSTPRDVPKRIVVNPLIR